VALNPESAKGVPAATIQASLPTVLAQILDTPAGVTGTGEDLFISSLQSALQTGAVGEIPLVAPYQLGLQAAQGLPTQVETPGQAGSAQSGATQTLGASTASEPLQTSPLDALNGTTVTAAVDPTSSSLFQAHAGALATNLFLAPAALAAGTTGAPTTLRVTETYAGAATSAFSEGNPANPNVSVLNVASPGRLSPNSMTGLAPLESVAAVYGPEGTAVAAQTRIGTAVDLTG
jgi:hypothetical protein